MARVKESSSKKKIRPALSPESRENQLISLAVDLAEKQLLEGTASSQVITHFLKLGTTKTELEKEKLRNETKLMQAKTENLESAKNIEAMYKEAIDAMRDYSGQSRMDDEDEY